MSETPPPVRIEPARKSMAQRFSIVWVIPILALAIALGVAWQSYNERGPLIEIEFENGAGIAKRETELRYRDITVGVVEDLQVCARSDGCRGRAASGSTRPWRPMSMPPRPSGSSGPS